TPCGSAASPWRTWGRISCSRGVFAEGSAGAARRAAPSEGTPPPPTLAAPFRDRPAAWPSIVAENPPDGSWLSSAPSCRLDAHTTVRVARQRGRGCPYNTCDSQLLSV